MIYFDGACEKNPGGRGGFAFTHVDDSNEEHHFECGFIKSTTNNMAEYIALLRALLYCKLNSLHGMKVRGDSMLVINQVKGLWRIKSPSLSEINQQCVRLYDELKIDLQHVRREQNTRADYLSKLPLQHVSAHGRISTRSQVIILP